MWKSRILYTGCCNTKVIKWAAWHGNYRGIEEEPQGGTGLNVVRRKMAFILYNVRGT
jgi:hypothetical protein